MANILLLGAGFSANWDAPVTKGVFNALIADAEVQGSQQIHTLLWQNRLNFENALSVLQHNDRQNQSTGRAPLLLMQRALGRVFASMNTLLKVQQFELRGRDGHISKAHTVTEFLARFDAIFTLNQDLLLEMHYFDQAKGSLTDSRRWSGGGRIPGMTGVGDAGGFGGPAWSGRTWNPNGDFSVPNNAQPFYKLHGSTNWKETGGNADITIMGGGKSSAIEAIPVLKHYHDTFKEYVKRGDTRVAIIGYGFGDDHINEALEDAVRNNGLRMFVCDPLGSGLAYAKREYIPGQIGALAVTPFEEWFQQGLHSASAIPFRKLLWNDTVEGEIFNKFIT